MSARVTKAVREACLRLSEGKSVGSSEHEQSAWSDAIDLDLVHQVNFDYELTEAGKKVAEDHKAAIAKQRASRRAYAAGRASAMSSLGMTRTRSGSWE